jgi:hypothetical protein
MVELEPELNDEDFRRFAPPQHRAPPEGTGQLGVLSAAAVDSIFEIAARDIDAMGAELKAAAQRCEAILSEIHTAIEDTAETARAYRARGQRISEELGGLDRVSKQVTRTCAAMRTKIAATVASV